MMRTRRFVVVLLVPLVAGAVLAGAWWNALAARPPVQTAAPAAHDVGGLVGVNVAQVLLVGGQPAVLLLDEPQERYLLIFIDLFMANAIHMGLQGERFERPLTHDLIATLLQRLGGRVRHVAIPEVRENTYYARLALQVNDGEETALDVRPSDALAIAVRVGAAVYAAPDLLSPVAEAPWPGQRPPPAPELPEPPRVRT